MERVKVSSEQLSEITTYYVLREDLGRAYSYLDHAYGFFSETQKAEIEKIIKYILFLYQENGYRLNALFDLEGELEEC